MNKNMIKFLTRFTKQNRSMTNKDLAKKNLSRVTDAIRKKSVLEKISAELDKQKGIVVDIESATKGNTNFRKVLYTGKKSQLVLMALKANEEIGEETHNDTDQFFRVDEGGGKVVINDIEHTIKDGSAFIIPQGAKHNVIAGKDGLKVYSVYSPPNHADGTIHKTKSDAEKSKEKFNGGTTE